MPYTYTLTTVIPATPQQIYRAWLDSEAHSEMTGGEATMSGEVGAEVSAWDGYITGANLELVPGERIVQSWRTSEFTDQHADSIVTVTLEPVDEGTLLTLIHSNVPDDHTSYEEGGWESQYFEPMKIYFAGLEDEEAAAAPPPEPAPASPPEPKPQRALAEMVKPAEPPAPRVKASPTKKKKAKSTVSAKAKRKSVKPSGRKAARRAAPKRKAPKKVASKRAASKKAASKRKSAPRKRARR